MLGLLLGLGLGLRRSSSCSVSSSSMATFSASAAFVRISRMSANAATLLSVRMSVTPSGSGWLAP